MEITSINDYLAYRLNFLKNEYSSLKKEYDFNKIQINEIRKKIDEIKSSVDEGFEMFSPIAAEDNNFNKQEIKKLQLRAYIFVEDNRKISVEIDKIGNEIRTIHNMLLDYTNDKSVEINQDIEYEISDNELFGEGNSLLIDILEECVDKIDSDPAFVKDKLVNIVNEIKER